MSIARARALRSLQGSLRHTGARATPRISGQARTQLAVGRRYASGGDGGHAAPSSDLPWAIGAVAVTIPACWYLWPDTSHADGGHHDAHGDHGEHAEAHDEEEGEKEAPEAPESEEKEEPVEASEQKDDEPTQDTNEEDEKSKESEYTAKPSGTEGDSQPVSKDANKKSDETDEPEQKETPEKGGNTESAAFKGKVKPDSPAVQNEERKREPDAKGAFKKRIDSGLGKNLGEGPQKEEPDDPNDLRPKKEAAKPSKEPTKETGEITGKQYGLSNTPTRHSLEIDKDPEKSKKAEGGPDTAKVMGTVDPNRPAV